MKQESLSIERTKDFSNIQSKTVTDRQKIDLEKTHEGVCTKCGDEISIDNQHLMVMNPTFDCNSLIETVMNVTWYRLRRHTKNDDVFMKGEYVESPDDADSNNIYDKTDVLEQIKASITLNSWHGVYDKHSNSPILYGDYINHVCKNCKSNGDLTDTQVKQGTDSTNYSFKYILKEYGIGIILLTLGFIGAIYTLPTVGVLVSIMFAFVIGLVPIVFRQ